MNSPHILLLATGGTIAGVATPGHGYQAATLNIETLLAELPPPPLPVEARQLMALDSRDFTPEFCLHLARQVEAGLRDPQVAGVVITHGTDTMEETAYFLSQVLAAHKPVVLTGAMRPANALSSDGTGNLQQALRLAACQQARGVLAVMGDVIWAGAEMVKNNASQMAAFASPWGPLGQVGAEQVSFYRLPPANPCLFSLVAIGRLALVPLLYGYVGLSPEILLAGSLPGEAQGLVYAAPGNGSVGAALQPVLSQAWQSGATVVVASRTGAGWVQPDYTEEFIGAGWLNPLQARIRLMLALSSGLSRTAIKDLFALHQI